MATVKVKFRPSIVEGKTGVIYYQITHKRKTRQITTKIRVHPSHWDADVGKLSPTAPNSSMVQNRINSDVALLLRVISDFDGYGVDYSVNEIINRYKLPQCHILVLDYMRSNIEMLYTANRFGTASNYKKTMYSFREFLDNLPLPLTSLSEQVIKEYNSFLVKRGLLRNSISFYMRIMRAVYNKAVRQKLIEQQYPFVDVYTGVDRTHKRAVSESIISQLYRLELQSGSLLSLCRDIFLFSYCTRGMAFVDIAYLKISNLQNGVIAYSRRKTGQLMIVRIEPIIKILLERYVRRGSIYVFPILNTLEEDKAYLQYRSALNAYNRLLGRLSEMLGCECKLTSYTSRHSWATAARNHNVPISVISQGMGHTTEQTTQIYLSMLENSVIDDANKKIIGDLV